MRTTGGKIIFFVLFQWAIPVMVSYFTFRENPKIYLTIIVLATSISFLAIIQHMTTERHLSTLVGEVKNLQEIIKCFRTQRHDFMNHLQIIYSMIQLNKAQQVPEYIQSVVREMNNCSNIFKIKSPQAAVFLFKKYQELLNFGVKMEVKTSPDIENIDLNDCHLLEVIDVILDNLADKIIKTCETEPRIQVELLCDGHSLSTVFRCEQKPELEWDSRFLREIYSHGGSLETESGGDQKGYCIKFTKDTVAAAG